ncbi:unnamed protein product [Onchocerca flexuosa]|uniref:DDE_Tnp_1_7 domain-containing protein n=1 Tax=Onchocerca flexuosa TaxID=387005 RepID=A0A183HMA7_9BILA|nr:unnamed protein product [Onchocerca flexuosa]
MAKMTANYGVELVILILFVMICPSLSSHCEYWEIEDFPRFVRKLPHHAKEEFCKIHEMEMDLSRKQFFEMLRNWGRKYSVVVSCYYKFI